MKKAYVKPVLVAEPYEMTETVAWCPESQYKTINVYDGAYLCILQNCHDVDVDDKKAGINGNYTYTDAENKTQTMTYWQYAGGTSDGAASTNKDVFLFSTGNYACDFLWSDPKEQIYVWNSPSMDARTENNWKSTGFLFSEFFYSNDSISSGNNHAPGSTLGRFFS